MNARNDICTSTSLRHEISIYLLQEIVELKQKIESETQLRQDLDEKVAKMNQLLATGQEALVQEKKTVELLKQQLGDSSPTKVCRKISDDESEKIRLTFLQRPSSIVLFTIFGRQEFDKKSIYLYIGVCTMQTFLFKRGDLYIYLICIDSFLRMLNYFFKYVTNSFSSFGAKKGPSDQNL